MELSDKIVLIPGASRPIGRAIARRFAMAGAHLVLPVYDWPESIEDMKEEFTERGFSFDTCRYDLRKRDEVETLAHRVNLQHGGLDYLINNIERGGMPVVHGSYDLPHNAKQWELEFDTTLKAKWFLFNSLFPLLKDRRGSAVVNISSIAAQTGRRGSAAPFFSDGYSAANCAIELFTRNWAKQAAPCTRVNELKLGLIRNRHGEKTRGWQALNATQKAQLLSDIALKRTGLPEEVADAVFFLGVEATYITGASLSMDGGFLLGNQNVPGLPAGIL